MENTSKQIIVMRTDLRNAQGQKIRTGKLVAQGAHASLAAILGHSKGSQDSVTIYLEEDSAIKDWLRGRFTKVCVAVNSEEELLEVYSKAKAKGLLCSLITDAGLTEFNGVATLTCCAIGPVWSNELEGITDHLKLL